MNKQVQEVFCDQCEEELTQEEITNANDVPELGKEAFTNGEIFICTGCYKNGYDDWVNESMQPCDTIDNFYGED